MVAENNLDLSALDGLSPEERELTLKILQQYATEGMSDLFTDLEYSDYEEIPVDIITFMHDRRYLGNALYNQEGKFTVFPYWEDKLKEIFPSPTETRYNTVVLTGAIGLGKSTIAVICLLYMLYRLLCLKDPYMYYGLQPIDKITISLMNITLENAKGVALDKMNQMILSSEWFMAHGEMSGTVNLEYRPHKHIELIAASSNNQVIGRALFCLSGDTVIKTTDGDKKISELVNEDLHVLCLEENGDIIISDSCTVQMTKESTVEYSIELCDGSLINCTEDHLFRLKDGTYKKAKDLTEDDDLSEVLSDLTYDKYLENIIATRGQWGIVDEYYEGHHIIPRCLGGSGKTKEKHSNIIRLYPREHFIAHWLLAQENPDNMSLQYAFSAMAFPKGKTKRANMLTPEEYDEARRYFADNITGKNNPMFNKDPWNKGLTKETDERVRKQADKEKGKFVSSETRALQSAIKHDYFLTHEQFVKGKICITDGKTNRYIDSSEVIPVGWEHGNNTVGKHPLHTTHKKHVIKDIEAFRKQKQLQSAGKNNPMFGKGHLLSGGNNGRATKRYFYQNETFESRQEFIDYLHAHGETIEYRHIQEWEEGLRRPKVIKNYSHIVNEFRWEYKNEG